MKYLIFYIIFIAFTGATQLILQSGSPYFFEFDCDYYEPIIGSKEIPKIGIKLNFIANGSVSFILMERPYNYSNIIDQFSIINKTNGLIDTTGQPGPIHFTYAIRNDEINKTICVNYTIENICNVYTFYTNIYFFLLCFILIVPACCILFYFVSKIYKLCNKSDDTPIENSRVPISEDPNLA
ncbi:MAG: hypothetical protein Edafosvirus12_5 [Edafosvirus sp.]|uniref:Uncharacterized protein n=1 Tax=Edafosvirus sp. TaxID=2487765 RepID=A0A3G4ZU18_9VIRU|nr:MAG: hypothetical protein Edafosvirus12_5 [Edafosvirus sp.]